MKVGYARVSTLEQNLDLQLQALNKADCEIIFQEKVSGANRQRPEFQRMLDHLRLDFFETTLMCSPLMSPLMCSPGVPRVFTANVDISEHNW